MEHPEVGEATVAEDREAEVVEADPEAEVGEDSLLFSAENFSG